MWCFLLDLVLFTGLHLAETKVKKGRKHAMDEMQ
jgi:hypothetical protein